MKSECDSSKIRLLPAIKQLRYWDISVLVRRRRILAHWRLALTIFKQVKARYFQKSIAQRVILIITCGE